MNERSFARKGCQQMETGGPGGTTWGESAMSTEVKTTTSIPVHLSPNGTPMERGLEFGRCQARRVARTIEAYRWLFQEVYLLSLDEIRSMGHDVAVQLSRRWPHFSEEIEGIARGSGQSMEELCAINARTEILAGRQWPECSVVAIVPQIAEEPVLLGQNWDWYSASRDSLVAWKVYTGGHEWFMTITEAGILAKFGFNSHGVGCCLNMLETTADGGPSKVPVHLLLRLVLEKCRSVSDAAATLTSQCTSASSAITVAQDGPNREAVCYELSPGGAKALKADSRGVLLHTNHFLSPPLSGPDTALESQGSRERLRELAAWSSAVTSPVGLEDLKSVFRSHHCSPMGICKHPGPARTEEDQIETLASVLMDLSARRMLVADGLPCETEYQEVKPE